MFIVLILIETKVQRYVINTVKMNYKPRKLMIKTEPWNTIMATESI
jgi:hypothetical protein